MRNSFICFVIVIFNIANLFSQNNFFILRGEIIDKQQNIPVEKAEVLFISMGKTIKTEKNGCFSVALSSGKQIVQIFHKDYQVNISTLDLQSDTTIKFYLSPLINSLNLEEVIIVAKSNKVEQTLMSVEKIEATEIKKIPAIGGEKDIVKALTFLPGVQNSSEGSAEIKVRGGTQDQNLMLLDNSVMYNSTHLYGFLSSFNPSVVSSATLYKAAFPAKFGGRLSSILEANTKEINMKKFQFECELGLISAKAVIQIPIISDKSALLISGRRTYFDFFVRAFDNDDVSSFNFYDSFIKYSHKLNDKNKIDFFFYIDRDNNFWRQTYKPNGLVQQNFISQNKIAGINYEMYFSKKIINNISVNYSSYTTKIIDSDIEQLDDLDTLKYFQSYTSEIEDFTVKNNLQFKINSKLILNSGISFVYHDFKPSFNHFHDEIDTIENRNIADISALDVAVYSDIEYFINSKTSFLAGIRLSDYIVKNKNFINPETRFSANFRINKTNSIKCSYSRMTQPIHLITNSGLGMPVNIWLSSDNIFKPEKSDQFTLGFTNIFKIKEQKFSFTFESYYKTMNNLLNYLDGYSSNYFTSFYDDSFIKVDNWHDIITAGSGKSYGTEFLLTKTSGKFVFQAAYTLSWTFNQYENLNKGNQFPATNDRRHNFSTYLNYSPSKRFEFGFAFVFMSGQPITLPLNAYFYPGIAFDKGSNQAINETLYTPIYAQSEKNIYRMNAYNRLDLSFKWNFESGKKNKFKSTLSIDMYNVYNRKNPYYYYLDFETVYDPNSTDGGTLGNKAVLKSVSLFPIIPSISYNLNF